MTDAPNVSSNPYIAFIIGGLCVLVVELGFLFGLLIVYLITLL